MGLAEKALFVGNTQECQKPKGATTKEIRRETHLHTGCQEQMKAERGQGWGRHVDEGAMKGEQRP